MKKYLNILTGSLFALAAINANAATLWINGTATPAPTSYADAVDNDFFFVFQSTGENVHLERTILLQDSCQLALGGWVWEENDEIHVAITHGDPNVSGKSGLCSLIGLYFNNNYATPPFVAGPWSTSIPVASLPTTLPGASITDVVTNVQVETSFLGWCSETLGTIDGNGSANGSGGNADATFSNNGLAGTASSFTFDTGITPNANGSTCEVDGEVVSVNTPITSWNNKQTPPHAATLPSRGIVQITQ